ncbi:hypothetical protein D3C84_449110 [compost metagenome]
MVVAVQDLALLFFQLRKVEPRPVHPVAELQTELRRGVLPGVHQHGLFAGRGCQQQVTFMASHVEITLAPLITLLAFLKLPALVQIIPIDLAPVPLWDQGCNAFEAHLSRLLGPTLQVPACRGLVVQGPYQPGEIALAQLS